MTGTRLWRMAGIPANLSSLQSPAIKALSKRPQGGIWAKLEVPGCRRSESGPISPSAVPRLCLIFPNCHHRLAVTQGLAAGDAALPNSPGSPSQSRSEPPSFTQTPQSLGHPHQHHPLHVPEVSQCLVSAG